MLSLPLSFNSFPACLPLTVPGRQGLHLSWSQLCLQPQPRGSMGVACGELFVSGNSSQELVLGRSGSAPCGHGERKFWGPGPWLPTNSPVACSLFSHSIVLCKIHSIPSEHLLIYFFESVRVGERGGILTLLFTAYLLHTLGGWAKSKLGARNLGWGHSVGTPPQALSPHWLPARVPAGRKLEPGVRARS